METRRLAPVILRCNRLRLFWVYVSSGGGPIEYIRSENPGRDRVNIELHNVFVRTITNQTVRFVEAGVNNSRLKVCREERHEYKHGKMNAIVRRKFSFDKIVRCFVNVNYNNLLNTLHAYT